jgi:diketogulonate reductase-like aldo/keto reductase
MAGKKIPEVLLNSGHKMPVIGMGTSVDNRPSNDVLASIFVDAIEVGYRHFDSASVYGTEKAIGMGTTKWRTTNGENGNQQRRRARTNNINQKRRRTTTVSVRWLPGEIDFRRGEREGEYEQMYRFVLLGKRESI